MVVSPYNAGTWTLRVEPAPGPTRPLVAYTSAGGSRYGSRARANAAAGDEANVSSGQLHRLTSEILAQGARGLVAGIAAGVAPDGEHETVGVSLQRLVVEPCRGVLP